MRIDVWSDILCPFCHLGRRHLELALERFDHADEVDIVWHSYQLDREAPAVIEGANVDRVADKYGVSHDQMVIQHEQMAKDAAAVGLDFRWDETVGGNSYDAHRLLHFARSKGLESPVQDRIMRAWYSEGASIGDHDTLVALATEAGLDEGEVRDVLAGDDFGIDVRSDEALASQIGITAVPTFVLDQKYGVTGAQPVDIMLKSLEYAWADQGNPVQMAGGGGCCGGGGGGCGCGGGAQADADEAEAQQGGCGGGGSCGCADGAAEADRAATVNA